MEIGRALISIRADSVAESVRCDGSCSHYALELVEAFHSNIGPAHLFVGLPLVFYPASGMRASRVAVSPMDNTAFFIPFVFTVKLNAVTGF